jgi:hypothetical protein
VTTTRVACVAEARPHWVTMVENLAVSLRNYGGQLASAPLLACFAGPADSGLLAALGADVVEVPPYPGVARTTNKLRMFEAFAADPGADRLLALDCDVVVVGDLSPDLPTETVGMMPAVMSHLSPDQWEDLLKTLELPVAARTTTLHDGTEIPAPYFNSGVLSLPAALAAPLVAAWKHYVDVLDGWAADPASGPATLPYWKQTWLWGDQIALSAALLATDTPVTSLDPGLNLTTGLSWRSTEERFLSDRPRLLHYHGGLTRGGLLRRSDAPLLNEVIDEVNQLLAVRAGRTGDPVRDRVVRRVRRRPPADHR